MPSLLAKLGGRDAIELVVAGLCERVMSDPHLLVFFRDVSRARYEMRLADYLCALLDGRPAAWKGRDLSSVHADLAIRTSDFARFVAHLAATLAAADVPTALGDQVLTAVGSVRGAIVTNDEEIR